MPFTQDSIGGLRVGLFGIGLDAYWPQFAGLQERLAGYVKQVESKLERPGVEVVNLGLVDTPEKAQAAGHQFRRTDVDLIFLHVTTYALSSTVLPVVQPRESAGDHPQPATGSGDRLQRFQPNGRPHRHDRRLAGLLLRLPGAGDRQCLQRAAKLPSTRSPACWIMIRNAGAKSTSGSKPLGSPTLMEHNRLGLMGHYYSGMLDIYYRRDAAVSPRSAGILRLSKWTSWQPMRREVTAEEIAGASPCSTRHLDVQPDCAALETRTGRTHLGGA